MPAPDGWKFSMEHLRPMRIAYPRIHKPDSFRRISVPSTGLPFVLPDQMHQLLKQVLEREAIVEHQEEAVTNYSGR